MGFKVGDLVYSEKFGKGKVVLINTDGANGTNGYPLEVKFKKGFWTFFTLAGVYNSSKANTATDLRKVNQLKGMIEHGI